MQRLLRCCWTLSFQVAWVRESNAGILDGLPRAAQLLVCPVAQGHKRRDVPQDITSWLQAGPNVRIPMSVSGWMKYICVQPSKERFFHGFNHA